MCGCCGPEFSPGKIKKKTLFACVEHPRPDLCFLTSPFVCFVISAELKEEASRPVKDTKTLSSDLIEYVQHMIREHREDFKVRVGVFFLCCQLLLSVCLSVEVDFKFLPKEIENKNNISSCTVVHTSSPLPFCAPLFTFRHHLNTRLLFPVFAACLSHMMVPHFCLFFIDPLWCFLCKTSSSRRFVCLLTLKRSAAVDFMSVSLSLSVGKTF